MALRKHEPVSVEDMHHVSPQNTICQTLREIYWNADNPEKVRRKARVATAMAKAMDRKLTEYSGANWEKKEGFWEDNEHFDEILRRIQEKA